MSGSRVPKQPEAGLDATELVRPRAQSLIQPRVQRLGDERTEISWQLAQAGEEIAGGESASDGSTVLDPGEAQHPSRIGPYRILELLGQGGMGAVYLAEQAEPIRRQVAIKLIHPEMMSRSALLRFDAERQALALMKHPNIAQIFEAGTTSDGHPFVVMEALVGEPLTTYCDRRKLSLRQRLEIFRQVCAGVQHAHQKGVLHRDLKPNNVLVVEDDDGRPQVKIIDFGIAKALDDPLVDATQLTNTYLLGTPAYLSPESIDSAEQGADVRSDVYALGVLLYELLSSGRPFERAGSSQVDFLWRIVNEEAKRPSARFASWADSTQERAATNRDLQPAALLRRLRRELDWLVLKAIAKDREDRYPSVSALDADVFRYLDHRPLHAASPSRVDRLVKWVRRNRAALAVAGVILLILVGGIVARTLEAQRANREAAAARQAEEEAREVVRFLTHMFHQADPARFASGDPVTAREVLDWGVETIGRQDMVERPTVRVSLLFVFADVLISLGDATTAKRVADEAIRIIEDDLGGMTADRARILGVKALAEARLGHSDLAEESFLRAVEILEQGGPADVRAPLLMNLGTFYAQEGVPDKAEEYFRRGLEQADQVDNQFAPPANEARHLSNYGGVLASAGKLEEAERVLRRGYIFAAENLGPSHPLRGYLGLNLGTVVLNQGRPAEAVPLFRDSLAVFEQSFEQSSGTPSPVLPGALANLARALGELGQYEEARPLLRRALELREAQLGPDHPATQNLREALEAMAESVAESSSE